MTRLRKAGRLVLLVLAAVGLITVLVITTPLVRWWAHSYSGPIRQPDGNVLILLSAASDNAGGISYSSYWRARQAVSAWQTGNFKKIVITGGGGPGIVNFLAACGIPRDRMVAEWQSNSTRENAINTARLVQGMPGRKVLLTSDFHIYRAIRVFRKAGMDVAPMPAPDVLHATEHWNGRFQAFEMMVVETAKIVYYRARGWM
ncbi:MAG TPA: YdcF family protein [Terracidiphilus sp.]|jgi:uncharacterized SAM-binding protein YcdF (DUF218 family)